MSFKENAINKNIKKKLGIIVSLTTQSYVLVCVWVECFLLEGIWHGYQYYYFIEVLSPHWMNIQQ